MSGPASSAEPAGAPLLGAEGLAAGYADGRAAISGVGFAAPAGSRVALLGPNGGGKTTLLRVLLGELEPRAGTVTAPRRCGYVPQTDRSRLDYPVSATDVVMMGTIGRLPWWRPPGRAERRAAADALRQVGMAQLADATYGELSGGQRQRVLVARALVQGASVLLADEPFRGVDEGATARLRDLLDALAAGGRTVVAATHDVELARSWDLVLCLNRRQIAFGPPQRTLTREVLEATYGEALIELPDGGSAPAPAHHHDDRAALPGGAGRP